LQLLLPSEFLHLLKIDSEGTLCNFRYHLFLVHHHHG